MHGPAKSNALVAGMTQPNCICVFLFLFQPFEILCCKSTCKEAAAAEVVY